MRARGEGGGGGGLAGGPRGVCVPRAERVTTTSVAAVASGLHEAKPRWAASQSPQLLLAAVVRGAFMSH